MRPPRQVIHQWLGGAALAAALLLTAGGAAAQPATEGAALATPAAPATAVVTPRDPAPDDTNAERDKTQPGNNAPFWRDVRTSGEKPGVVNLPGAGKRRADPAVRRVPRLQLHHRR